MTTRVTITNDSDLTSFDNHAIEVVDSSGAKHIIGPERSISLDVWQGTQITIIELDSVGQKRGGPNGYGVSLPRKGD